MTLRHIGAYACCTLPMIQSCICTYANQCKALEEAVKLHQLTNVAQTMLLLVYMPGIVKHG